jgi:hypothetical protein
VSIQYYISGGILLVLGIVQMWVRRQEWAGEQAGSRRSALLGPAAVVVGLVLLAAGFLAR